MVKYRDLNVLKVGMQKREGWRMETVGWNVGGLALYDGLFHMFCWLIFVVTLDSEDLANWLIQTDRPINLCSIYLCVHNAFHPLFSYSDRRSSCLFLFVHRQLRFVISIELLVQLLWPSWSLLTISQCAGLKVVVYGWFLLENTAVS